MLRWWVICVLAGLCTGNDNDLQPQPQSEFLPVLADLKAAYYINLDSVPLRRWHMEQQLHYTGLPAKRFSAVTSKRVAAGDFNKEYIDRQGLDPITTQKSPRVAHATAACFLSHVELLKKLAKELKPQDIGLIMEDDVVIPADWSTQIQAVIRGAPKGWHLLKVSGWGRGREVDLVSQPSTWSKMKGYLLAPFKQLVPQFKYYDMQLPFIDGEQNYYYAGSGAYFVRGSSIPSILRHLQSRPIKDMDSMLLSNESVRFYEEWPHIFDLSQDSWGIHSNEIDDTLKAPNLTWTRAFARFQDSVAMEAALGPSHDRRHARHVLNHTRHAKIRLLPRLANAEDSKEQNMFLKVQSSGHLRRHRGRPPTRTHDFIPFDHPSWLHECKAIFLDVGSSRGEQVQKLFEPELFPGASALPLFDFHFGLPLFRAMPSKKSGLCALGIEPDPEQQRHLQELVEGYAKRGWDVHFYPYAAWREEGTLSLHPAEQIELADEAHLLHNTTGQPSSPAEKQNLAPFNARTVDLAQFVKSLPDASVRLMRMNINGAEYETIDHMIEEKVLCSGSINMASIYAHPWGDSQHWQPNLSYKGIEERLSAADCDGNPHTVLLDLDYFPDTEDQHARQSEKGWLAYIVLEWPFFPVFVLMWVGLTMGCLLWLRSRDEQTDFFGPALRGK